MNNQERRFSSVTTAVELPQKLVPINKELLRSGRLFASQEWIKPEKFSKAHDYNDGHSRYKSKLPSIYPFIFHNRVCYLVGNGHHRIADALLRNIGISAEIDLDLGKIGDELMKDNNRIQQKFAPYGIETIIPFENFLEKFSKLSDLAILAR